MGILLVRTRSNDAMCTESERHLPAFEKVAQSMIRLQAKTKPIANRQMLPPFFQSDSIVAWSWGMLTKSMGNANQGHPVFESINSRVIVAAASARALAASCLFAGHPVSTIDLFADADTALICGRSDRYLSAEQSPNFFLRCKNMEEIAARLGQIISVPEFYGLAEPPMILVGGGFEKCVRSDSVLNSSALQHCFSVLEQTSRWRNVEKFCRSNVIRFPRSTRERDVSPSDSRWLLKTDFSSGGLGVQVTDANAVLKADEFLQECVDGRSISACYVSAPMASEGKSNVVEMLGVCEPVSSLGLQPPNLSCGQPMPFRYTGSVGPVNLSASSDAVHNELKRVGKLAASHFKVVGVFGIDFILKQDELWLLEINPRFTASAELIERSARQRKPDFSIAKMHLNALLGKLDQKSDLIASCQNVDPQNLMFAKQIVYRHHHAAKTLRVTASHIEDLARHFSQCLFDVEVAQRWPSTHVTDIPSLETDVWAGEPILTLHVAGDGRSQCQHALARAVALLETIFQEPLV